MTSTPIQPSVWFPTIRAGSGADVFTERLAEGLRRRGLKAEITWLPHRAEYLPWSVTKPEPPAWANIAHVNTWLHRRFLPKNLPLIATMHHCVHGDEVARFKTPAQTLYHRLWVKRLERHVLVRADRITAVSRYSAARTTAIYRTNNIVVIHNGIDTRGVFQPAPRQEPNEPFRLLYVGNWSKRKGVDLLAPIMSRLGTGFELAHTGNSITNAPDNMHSIGILATQSALADAYRQADALLFPSRLEGFGLVALEAHACGLPVIATHGSALPEVIEHGVTGLLCPQDDVQAFVDAAKKMADDTARWQRMRRAALERAETHFSMEHMLDRYIDLYRSILLEKK